MQSYSVLTQLAAIDFEQLCIEHGMQDRITLVNQIHDALYFELDDDLEVIHFVNTYLPQAMCKPFLHDQSGLVLQAECDVGYNLNDVVTLPNNCDLATIKQLLER